MSIRISDGGGLAGFGSITIPEDKAEVMLEALAEVLGAKVDFGWAEKEFDSEQGSVYVERI